MAFLLPLALGAAAPAVTFAPPLDQPIVFVLTSERASATGIMRFTARRRVTFHATADGYLAELAMLDASDQGAGDAGTMFMAAMVALKGRTIRFGLDRRGRVTGIADLTPFWTAICDAVDRMGSATAPRQAVQHRQNTRMLAQALRTMPLDKVRAMLASLIAPLLADPAAAGYAAGDHVASVPAEAPDGTAFALAGIEHVSIGDAAITIDVQAEGEPGAPPSSDPARIRYRAHRVLDPRTGLTIAASEERTAAFAAAPAEHHLLARSTMTWE